MKVRKGGRQLKDLKNLCLWGTELVWKMKRRRGTLVHVRSTTLILKSELLCLKKRDN
jgi:hypothetical protein